jgi:hypothetical protein
MGEESGIKNQGNILWKTIAKMKRKSKGKWGKSRSKI